MHCSLHRHIRHAWWLAALALVVAGPVSADIPVPSNGANGALHITEDTTINLANAVDGAWDDATTRPDTVGVYDTSKWAVVFHYTSVIVDEGATLTFANHGARAPVVWLVQQDVVINGSVNLDGVRGATNTTEAEGGPGGFRGGRGCIAGAGGGRGFGPGGGQIVGHEGGGGSYGEAGTYGGPTYGNPQLLPLIGGSGGAGGVHHSGTYPGGSGGGGAILIAAAVSIEVNGLDGIVARGAGNGDGGGGAGGGIRLVADRVVGDGRVIATGGNAERDGGDGRIRVEVNDVVDPDLVFAPGAPLFSVDDPGETPTIFPDSSHPTVTVTALDGAAVGDDPHADLNFPRQDVRLSGDGTLAVELETENVDPTATVEVFIVLSSGDRQDAAGMPPAAKAVFRGGNKARATWTAEFTEVPNGSWVVQARAILPQE